MLPTHQIYDVVTHQLALMDRQLKAYGSTYDRLSAKTSGYSAYGSGSSTPSETQNLVTKGDTYLRQRLVEATPLFHLRPGLNDNGGYDPSRDKKFADQIDALIAHDVAKADLSSSLGQKIIRPYTSIPHSDIPVRGYAHAQQALADSIREVSKTREVVRNLARTLKIALSPDLASYKGTPSAQIDNLAVDVSLLQKGEWAKINEIALKSLGPVSTDEHVIDRVNGDGSYAYSSGTALLVFGKNTYGESEKPVYGIWTRYAYSNQVELFPNQAEAEKIYRERTSPGEYTKVRHTREGNFVGGAFSKDTYHPNSGVGSPQHVAAAAEPWVAGDIKIAAVAPTPPKAKSWLTQRLHQAFKADATA